MSDPEKEQQSPGTERENQTRWEYDLPLVSDDDVRERNRRYMEETYGYDIDS